ncbi:hypothetical protein D3OALGA1CA_2443 [Olavius algarvensis associated proteobacterium Delta 3]|nr:hypothetical protein D3OALGA1CA_2443 [Olavius algarvensis associated proteobacterium Delta 3]CAB5155343.1 hypothetical protein D3OALGB2SA_5068 [Olavius algarvensis associated proteobacterium Delta 3]
MLFDLLHAPHGPAPGVIGCPVIMSSFPIIWAILYVKMKTTQHVVVLNGLPVCQFC